MQHVQQRVPVGTQSKKGAKKDRRMRPLFAEQQRDSESCYIVATDYSRHPQIRQVSSIFPGKTQRKVLVCPRGTANSKNKKQETEALAASLVSCDASPVSGADALPTRGGVLAGVRCRGRSVLFNDQIIDLASQRLCDALHGFRPGKTLAFFNSFQCVGVNVGFPRQSIARPELSSPPAFNVVSHASSSFGMIQVPQFCNTDILTLDHHFLYNNTDTKKRQGGSKSRQRKTSATTALALLSLRSPHETLEINISP